jgi:mannose-1-phosphate guanylyltransferase
MIALIMAGGSGTRFWPLSTVAKPKQFLSLTGGVSLLAGTAARIEPLVPPDRILVITGHPHVERSRQELPQIPAENIIGEPLGKNTAPCVAVAAALAEARFGREEVMVVLPADHSIAEEDRFQRTLRVGEEVCRREKVLLTLGVKPTGPETGYGYLEMGDVLFDVEATPVYRVKRFVEKPDREKAERLFRSGRHLWNSGMFLWSVEAIVDAIEVHTPELAGALPLFREADGKGLSEALEKAYPGFPSLSVDYGIMEKAGNVAALAADFPWSDVGSWGALGDLLCSDDAGNVVVGRHVGVDTSRSTVYSSGRLIATIGADGLIIVETESAVLVARKERSQEVRQIVRRLRDLGYEDLL